MLNPEAPEAIHSRRQSPPFLVGIQMDYGGKGIHRRGASVASRHQTKGRRRYVEFRHVKRSGKPCGIRHAALLQGIIVSTPDCLLGEYLHEDYRSSDAIPADEAIADSEANITELILAHIIEHRQALLLAARQKNVRAAACFELLEFDFSIGHFSKPLLTSCRPSHEAAGLEPILSDTLALIGLLGSTGTPTAPGPESDDAIIAVAETEHTRRRGFTRLIPSPSVALQRFPFPLWADLVLARAINPSQKAWTPSLIPTGRIEFTEDGMAVHAASGASYAPNDTAGFIALRAIEGTSPDEIIKEITCRFPDNEIQIRHDVWNTIADWIHKGVLAHESSPFQSPPPPRVGEGRTHPRAVPDETGFALFKGLGDEIWRQYIDLDHHHHGPHAYDLGLGRATKEPGYDRAARTQCAGDEAAVEEASGSSVDPPEGT